MPESVADLVAQHPLLAGLPGDAVTLVAGCAKNVAFAAGQLILAEGEPADTAVPGASRPGGPRGARTRAGGDHHRDPRPGPGRGVVLAVPALLAGSSTQGPSSPWRGRPWTRCACGRRPRPTRVRLRAHEAARLGGARSAPGRPDAAPRPLRRGAPVDDRCSEPRSASHAVTSTVPTPRAQAPWCPPSIESWSAASRRATSSPCRWRRSRAPMPFRGGQFNMLTAFGVGEAAISISSPPEPSGPLGAHRPRCRRCHPRTVRRFGRNRGWRAGAVRHGLGSRGDSRTVQDVVVVAGRDRHPAPCVLQCLHRAGALGAPPSIIRAEPRAAADRAHRGPVARPGHLHRRSRGLAPGRCRGPGDRRCGRSGLDRPGRGGHDACRLRGARPGPHQCLVCGPEIMMRFTARALLDQGSSLRASDLSRTQHAVWRRPVWALPTGPAASVP